MKVTAFIRKTAAKNNITDQARVYFRVRDIGGVDIKAASELSINPNHWSPERQGYKPRVALVSEEKKNAFDRDIQQITHLITREYSRGVDGNWLKGLIEEYHHPNINARGGNKVEEYLLSYQIQKYVDETPLAFESRKHHLDNLNKVLRYERFRHEVMHQRGFHLCIDTVTADDIRDFKLWMQEEHKYVDMYPVFYRNEKLRDVGQKRSENSMSGSLYRIRTIIKWCIKRGLTRNNPFDQYQIARPMYGDPFYLTLEERDKVYYADLSGMGATYPVYRDIFMFQGEHRGRLRGVHPAEDEDGTCQYSARAAQPEGTGYTGTLQGSGGRPAPPVLALRLQQEDKGDTQVRGHRPQCHSPRPQDKGGCGKTFIRGRIYPYGAQDLHRQSLQAGQGSEPDCLHVGTFGKIL